MDSGEISVGGATEEIKVGAEAGARLEDDLFVAGADIEAVKRVTGKAVAVQGEFALPQHPFRFNGLV